MKNRPALERYLEQMLELYETGSVAEFIRCDFTLFWTCCGFPCGSLLCSRASATVDENAGSEAVQESDVLLDLSPDSNKTEQPCTA